MIVARRWDICPMWFVLPTVHLQTAGYGARVSQTRRRDSAASMEDGLFKPSPETLPLKLCEPVVRSRVKNPTSLFLPSAFGCLR